MITKVYGASHAKALEVILSGNMFSITQRQFGVYEFLHHSKSKGVFTEYFKAHPAADWEAVGERAERLVKVMMSPEEITKQFAPDVEIHPGMPTAIYNFLLDALGAEDE